MEQNLLVISVVMVIIPVLILYGGQQQRVTLHKKLHRRQRSKRSMSNELIQSLVGKQCDISTGPFGESFKKVEVVSVADNWIYVRDGQRERLINSDYITSIKTVKQK